nr:hypothetical protein CFP56_38781 [Quercus suber]
MLRSKREMQNRLVGGRHAVDAPVLLGAKGAAVVLLPHVVVRVEQVEAAREGGLERADGRLLVGLAGHGLLVGVTLRRPAGLGDDGLLATAGGRDALGLAEHELTGLVGGDPPVEEGVAVGGDVVTDLAESGVGDDGDEGVDGDDRAGVAGQQKLRLGHGDGGGDLHDGLGARVDELVTDGDGVDGAPVAVDGGADGAELGDDGVDVEDSGEQLHALGLGGSQDVGDLVAVGAVGADLAVAIKLLEIGGHLHGALAGAIGLVGRVGQTQTRAGAVARGSAGGSGGGRGAAGLGVGGWGLGGGGGWHLGRGWRLGRGRGGVGRRGNGHGRAGGRGRRNVDTGGGGGAAAAAAGRRAAVGHRYMGLVLGVLAVLLGGSRGGRGRGTGVGGGRGLTGLVHVDHDILDRGGRGYVGLDVGDDLTRGVVVTAVGLGDGDGGQAGEAEKAGFHLGAGGRRGDVVYAMMVVGRGDEIWNSFASCGFPHSRWMGSPVDNHEHGRKRAMDTLLSARMPTCACIHSPASIASETGKGNLA